MTDAQERLDWVDVAKGLSIILVVMMHSAFGVGADTGGTGYLHYVIGWATPFRMPEFFLISGLFLSQVIARPWLRYADRRVVHYLYFYAIWAVIHILFKVGLGERDPMLAAEYLLWAVIEPYGVLWFIYMLAVLAAATKVVHELRIPHWVALLGGAALQMAPIHTGSYIVDQFAEFFVFFYAGYALAPVLFDIVVRAQKHVVLALAGLAAWAVINGLLVFSPGYRVMPDHVEMGLAGLPGLHLVLAIIGAGALCVAAGLLAKLPAMEWLRWLGSKSIVVYLAFALPMAVTRTILIRLGVITDTGVLSTVVMLVAILSPLLLYFIIQRTGFGKFLFERPAWAHLPGAPGSRQAIAAAGRQPAE
jgi:uncharacterized membrane protein YcfT